MITEERNFYGQYNKVDDARADDDHFLIIQTDIEQAWRELGQFCHFSTIHKSNTKRIISLTHKDSIDRVIKCYWEENLSSVNGLVIEYNYYDCVYVKINDYLIPCIINHLRLS